MRSLIKTIKEREFLKFFLMFFSGTLLAQIVTISLSPILTRIYTPEDFGVYGVYISIVSLLIVFITGRYEYAINSTENEEDAISVFRIVNYLSFFSAGFIFILIVLIGDSIIVYFDLNVDKLLLYFIPFTLLLMGLLQGSTYYLNRHKKFDVLSKSKIYQSFSNGTFSLMAGLMSFGPTGLVIANIVGIFTSHLYQRVKDVYGIEFKLDRIRLKRNLLKYRHYPLYNAPSALFDNIAIQAPVFILLKFFSESVVGFYSLTLRVIGMPLSLVSTSISQVFLSKVSELHRNNKSYKAIIIKLAKYLALIGLVPFMIISFFGPSLFSLLFGANWFVAGEYAQILIIGYFFKFIVSPLSIVFFINQKVKLLSIIQTTRALTTVFVLIIFALNSDIKTVLFAYTIHEVIFYLIYLYFILKTSR